MGFRELHLKNTYRSVIDDIPTDFFNKVLPETTLYLRAAGYYSSNSLKSLSYGLSKMVWKEGKMKLLISPEISDRDLEAIKRGKLNPEKVVEDIFLNDECELENLMRNDNVKALAYLVANGNLKIKFVLNSDTAGLFHMKFGLLYDENNDIVSFSGSLNESEAGLKQNAEEIKVFKSYAEGQSVFIEADLSFFNDLFEGNGKFGSFYVVDLPKKSKLKLIEAFKRECNADVNGSLPPLRYYQTDAIEALKKAKMKGIVEMATGTGKTRVALEAIKWLETKTKKPLLVLVLSPVSVLVNQWSREWWSFFKTPPLVFGSSGKASLDDLYSMIHSLNRIKSQIIPCFCTYDYALKPSFMNAVFSTDEFELAIVCDEVHWMGANSYSKILEMDFKYRLGLSATPARFFDEEGTDKIISYFGGVVFDYKLGKAIDDGYLSEFNYYPQFSPLLQQEMNEYLKISKRISLMHRGDIGNDKDNGITTLLNRRAKVLKKAKNKIGSFAKIIDELTKKNLFRNTLIFFEDSDQISEYLDILNEACVLYNRLSGEESESERKKILERFNEGKIDCIISMRILDEGVNLNKADKALLLASTANPRQYIQRCGRVLRINQNKPKAEIYDFLVYPETSSSLFTDQVEKEILKKELKRASYFATYSSNKGENLSLILEIARKFNISINESS
jgi:superfamily II DNA or RNA helicase